MWLKNPAAASNLPRRRIMADSYAATQPSDLLWPKYLATIDQLEKKNKITPEQYFVLRHSIQAKSELMEKTLGDEKILTDATVEEILDIVQQRLRADDVARANTAELAKQEAIEKYEKEREARLQLEREIADKENERLMKIKNRAAKVARFITVSITILLMLTFGYISYAISPLGPLNLDPSNNLPFNLKIVAFGIFWLLLALQTLNSIIGFMPKTFIDKYQQKLEISVESLLTKLIS